jgi:hypothetical protein
MVVKMDKPSTYEIRVDGLLSEGWSDWFDGLAIRNNPNGQTVLSGVFIDQASLFGALNKLQALNLVLISVTRKSSAPQAEENQ